MPISSKFSDKMITSFEVSNQVSNGCSAVLPLLHARDDDLGEKGGAVGNVVGHGIAQDLLQMVATKSMAALHMLALFCFLAD